MKWRVILGTTILILALVLVWSIIQPKDLALPEEAVESQEARGNWEEPVVQAVERVGPATVKIETTREVVVDQFFFQELRQKQGLGSGVIYREDGHILTNNHVIAGAETILVQLADGRSFFAEIVGQDELTDLAVLKVKAEGLPVANFANSDDLRVGQAVIAIGNPLGQDHTVTTGVLSALNRDLLIDPQQNRYLEGMLQTDAAINPGNSGGPLLNQKGEVIGVTTAIIHGAQGLAFAIPSSAAKQIGDQIIEHGKALRLGILGGSLTPALKRSIELQTNLKLAHERGALVTRVLPDSVAEKAGLQQGDLITRVNGEEIAGMRELQTAVQNAGFGGKLNLTYFRGDRSQKIEISL